MAVPKRGVGAVIVHFFQAISKTLGGGDHRFEGSMAPFISSARHIPRGVMRRARPPRLSGSRWRAGTLKSAVTAVFGGIFFEIWVSKRDNASPNGRANTPMGWTQNRALSARIIYFDNDAISSSSGCSSRPEKSHASMQAQQIMHMEASRTGVSVPFSRAPDGQISTHAVHPCWCWQFSAEMTGR